MIRTTIFLILLVLITSCNEREKKQTEEYLVIEGSIDNSGSRELNLVDLKTEEVAHTFHLLMDGSFRDTLSVKEGYYYLDYHDQQQSLYLKPSYELEVTFDAADINKSIEWKGVGGPANNYMAEKGLLEYDLFDRSYYGYYTTLDEKDFLKLKDSIHAVKMELFKKVEHTLDEDFAVTEKSSLKYDRLEKISTYPRMKRNFDNEDFQVSETYPALFTNIDLSDESILKSHKYFLYAFTYLGYQNLNRTQQNDSLDYVVSFLDIVREQVENEAIRNEFSFYFVKYRLNLSSKPHEAYEKFKSISTNEAYNQIISQKYKSLTDLAVGDVSPDFEFEDIKGKKINLSDLKDKVIYIDLWATWCKPCIEEFPELEKLQNDFKGKDVYFVSICKSDKKENWEKMVRNEQLGGIQLFAPDDGHPFFKKYQVQGIPRFIILDKGNRVRDKNAKRPSDPKLREDLSSLL